MSSMFRLPHKRHERYLLPNSTTLHLQIFAVQMDRRVSDNVLDIEIYVAETDASAPAEGTSAPPEDSLVAR